MLTENSERQERLEEKVNHMVRIGTVTGTDPATAKVRVQFGDADRMVSYDLPVLFRKTQDDKDYQMPDIGEQVLCLFLPYGAEQGFVLGAVYSQADVPPVISQDKKHRLFADGTWREYDRSSHLLSGKNVGSENLTTVLDSNRAVVGRTQRGAVGGRVDWTAGSQGIEDPATPVGPVGPATDATIGSFLLVKPRRGGDVAVDGLADGAEGPGVHVFIDDEAGTINFRPGNWRYTKAPGEQVGTWARSPGAAPAINVFAEESPEINFFSPVVNMAANVGRAPCVLNIVGVINHLGAYNSPGTGATKGFNIVGPVALEGDMTQQGDFTQDGNINSTGTIIDGGGNTNHHSH